MGVLEILAGLVAAVVVLAAVERLLFHRLAWRGLLARRVVVNLKSGRGLDGLLVRRSGDLLFLRDATALEPGAAPVRMDGETVVARADVDFIQAL